MSTINYSKPVPTEKSIADLIKNMEKRWGLTLVSFLQPDTQNHVVKVQVRISELFGEAGRQGLRQSRPFIDFYDRQQFHCTHFTLTRSDPAGPVQAGTFVKTAVQLHDLFNIINRITSQIHPINVKLAHLKVSDDGHIVLLGECVDQDSVHDRRTLLTSLNQNLKGSFNITERSWDADESKFHVFHCSLGFVKRHPIDGLDAFAQRVGEIEFDPILLTCNEVTLVHHRYRSLAFPQQGSFTFPFGLELNLDPVEFSKSIALE
jgi:hypothetical protein